MRKVAFLFLALLLIFPACSKTKEINLSLRIPLLIKMLDEGSSEMKKNAARELGQYGYRSVDAAPALIETIRTDEDPDVRVAAVKAFKRIGPAAEGSVEAIISSLEDPDIKVRSAAMEVVGAYGPWAVDAIPLLIEALEDEDMAKAAMYALWEMEPEKTKAAVPILLSMLEDDDCPMRSTVAYTLGFVGSADDVVEPLIEALSDEDDMVRLFAAVSLGKFGEKAAPAIPALLEAVDSEDSNVSEKAIETLGKIGPLAKESAEPILLEIMRDEETASMRFYEAVDALIGMGTDDGIIMEFAMESLRRDNVEGIYKGLHIVQGLGPDAEEAVFELIALLDSDVRWVDARTAYTIGFIGPAAADAIPKLTEILGNGPVGKVDMEILQSACDYGFTKGDEAERIEKLRGDFSLQLAAAGALTKLGADPAKIVPFLMESVKIDGVFFRSDSLMDLKTLGPDAAAAVPVLISILDDPDGYHRESIVETLAEIGPAASAALPLLRKLAEEDRHFDSHDHAYTVQIAAKEAIAKIEGSS